MEEFGSVRSMFAAPLLAVQEVASSWHQLSLGSSFQHVCAFQVFDEDGSKSLSLKEFKRACRIYGFRGFLSLVEHLILGSHAAAAFIRLGFRHSPVQSGKSLSRGAFSSHLTSARTKEGSFQYPGWHRQRPVVSGGAVAGSSMPNPLEPSQISPSRPCKAGMGSKQLTRSAVRMLMCWGVDAHIFPFLGMGISVPCAAAVHIAFKHHAVHDGKEIVFLDRWATQTEDASQHFCRGDAPDRQRHLPFQSRDTYGGISPDEIATKHR